jgi:Delta3-Delta2-enoyl-CoA isomerase
VQLSRDGDVAVLELDEAHQVLNAATVAALHAALEEAEAVPGPAALVLTGRGKAFHQGLDLPWLLGLGERAPDFLRDVHAVFDRLLRTELPTVAAVNGHAQAGGAMLVCCADLRIMRADRGWFRLPEVELGLPFTVVMADLLAARLPQPVLHRALVLGERFGGAEAAAAGVVDLAVEGEGAALELALARAAELARHRGPTVPSIRRSLYGPLLATLAADADRPDPFTR